jgi:hypothetical protein
VGSELRCYGYTQGLGVSIVFFFLFSDAPSPCVGTWGRVSSSCSTSGTREVSNFFSRYAGCMEFTKYTSRRLSLTLCV